MTPIEWVCDILKREMSLLNGQVYLWDQKINIPPDNAIYIAVGVQSCKPFSNTFDHTSNGDGLLESQSTNFMATLSIDILSQGPDARDRKEEVILALRSHYARQVQESYGFYIAGLSSSFVNLSSIEGTAIPYRFNIAVNIQYKVVKEKQISYYDTYSKSVVTED